MACPDIPTLDGVTLSNPSPIGGTQFQADVTVQNSSIDRDLTLTLRSKDSRYKVDNSSSEIVSVGECGFATATFPVVSVFRNDPSYPSKVEIPVEVVDPEIASGGLVLGEFTIPISGSPCEQFSSQMVDTVASYDEDGDWNTVDLQKIANAYAEGNETEEVLQAAAAIWRWKCDPLSVSTDPSAISVSSCYQDSGTVNPGDTIDVTLYLSNTSDTSDTADVEIVIGGVTAKTVTGISVPGMTLEDQRTVSVQVPDVGGEAKITSSVV